jgi:hypothetical protein
LRTPILPNTTGFSPPRGSFFDEQLEGARPGQPMAPESRQLLDYFEMRLEYEAEKFSRFDTARLVRYREAKKQFAGESHEALYTQWQAGGSATVLASLHTEQNPKEDSMDRFSTYLLNYDYDLFGTLTSGSHNEAVAAGVQTQQ